MLFFAPAYTLTPTISSRSLNLTSTSGGANNMHIGDVNDIHSYPWPGLTYAREHGESHT